MQRNETRVVTSERIKSLKVLRVGDLDVARVRIKIRTVVANATLVICRLGARSGAHPTKLAST